ncbi:helix-turn-helix transcriptional regulator [Amycolatopsis sp. NPDC051372]|uniref:helix-turn-helix domain-containing protein n=1 Tax=Amycolatopsis sp. NPDC051372 TaxID=3155669 RepID=UPI00342B966C
MQDHPEPPREAPGDAIGAQAERTFALNMRALREELGVSQAGLAKKLERVGIQLDSTAITRIEKHADGTTGRTIRLSEAVAIAKVLNTSLANMVLPARSSLFEQLSHATEELESATDAADTANRHRDDAEEKVRTLQSRFVERQVPSLQEILRYTARDLHRLAGTWSEQRESFKQQRINLAKNAETTDPETESRLLQLEEKELICLDVLYRIEDAVKIRAGWRRQ